MSLEENVLRSCRYSNSNSGSVLKFRSIVTTIINSDGGRITSHWAPPRWLCNWTTNRRVGSVSVELNHRFLPVPQVHAQGWPQFELE